MVVTAGVPPGSILGPDLWNVLCNGVLDIGLTPGAKSIAYADDLAIVVTAQVKEELINRAEESIGQVHKWLREHNRELATNQTELVILRGPRKRELALNLGGKTLKPTKTVHYFGVTLDDRRVVGEHIKKVSKKAEERVNALYRAMPNIGGPGSANMAMMNGVVQSILLYGASVWHAAMRVETYRKRLESEQQSMLLRVASAYRTVSKKAIQVVTGNPPIDRLVEERNTLYRNGNEAP
ncbi:hypothetical protein JTB14_027291 [Gonioctena quinquepunctata]|nr:hypothetical protein JTB14_027291 [Gonioctena quinquepunctata]